MATDQNSPAVEIQRFLVDQNVGKLTKWLRLLGYDAVFFTGDDDNQMVKQALNENRILITRDTAIRRRKVALSGQLTVITFETEDAETQMQQLIAGLSLIEDSQPLSRCLEDNALLHSIDKTDVEKRVPTHTFKTQDEFMECPACGRVYWRGTHWQALERRLNSFKLHS